MVTFNPRPKNEKGIGHVDVENTTETPNDTTNYVPYAIGGAAALGLAASAFMLMTGDDNDTYTPPVPTPYQETYAPAATPAPAPVAPPVIAAPQLPTQTVPAATQSSSPTIAELERESIIAQQQAIYQSPYLQGEYQTYITAQGYEGTRGEDFALHASLSYPGSVSVLITDGAYAGLRVGFFPAGINGHQDDGAVIVERIGYIETVQSAEGADVEVFRLLPEAQRVEIIQNMERPNAAGQPVELSETAHEFSKIVNENGQRLIAFTIIGDPLEDGILGIRLFNEDSYSIDLNTGDFTVNSAFAYAPDYLETGITINVDDIPWVDGRVDMRQALEFKATPQSQRSSGIAAPRP